MLTPFHRVLTVQTRLDAAAMTANVVVWGFWLPVHLL
jgi:hypothetical protein